MSSSLRGRVFFTISLSPQKANASHPRWIHPSEYPVRIQCFLWGRLSQGKLRMCGLPRSHTYIHKLTVTWQAMALEQHVVFFFNFYYFQFCVYVARWVCTRHCGYPGRPEVSDPQEMTLKAVVSRSFSTWVVGTKTRESIIVNKEMN